MLKIKALVFVQDESHDDNGVHITDLYNRKAVIIAHIDSDGYSLPCIGMFRGNPKKWMSTSAIRIVNVTHWMPLPEPPEKE